MSNRNTKHTPGPWRVIDHDEDYVSITDQSQGYGICLCNQSSSPAFKANANLIAAAPELLEALDASLEILTDAFRSIPIASGNKVQTQIVAHQNQLRALIAKARGES